MFAARVRANGQTRHAGRLMQRSHLVIGLGRSGQSACAFLRRRKQLVYAYDDAPAFDTVRALEALGVVLVETFPSDIQRVIVSPGVPQTHPLYQTSKDLKLPIIGEAELGLLALSGPAIGITGTNGKTTTTLLVAHVLQTAGYKARAIGNIGVPVSTACDEMGNEEVAVVELSSFQLETMSSPTLDVAAILNLAPDHLDRYVDFAAYCAAKRRIVECLKPDGCLIPRPTETHLHKLEFLLQPSYRELLKRERENVMVACAICQRFDVAPEAFFRCASTFLHPAHRLEPVGECAGIFFVNDSKATNDAAVQHAVTVTAGPVTLIAGGRSKGNQFSRWPSWFKGKVEHVVAVGEAALEIRAALLPMLPVTVEADLPSAVRTAWALTPRGGTVLLSPGGTSFDAYPNFEARGSHFKKIVKKIINDKAGKQYDKT